jgi:predicted RecB family endonuclease
MGARFERYILDLLPALGLFPKASRHRIYRNGVEVGEVDILAVDGDGNTYAVEVKAGKIDITGILGQGLKKWGFSSRISSQ